MNSDSLPIWQVGQKVICVDDVFPRAILDWCDYLPRAGHVYTIRAMQLGYDGVTKLPSLGFLLEELVNPPSSLGYEAGFDQTRFATWLDTGSEAKQDLALNIVMSWRFEPGTHNGAFVSPSQPT